MKAQARGCQQTLCSSMRVKTYIQQMSGSCRSECHCSKQRSAGPSYLMWARLPRTLPMAHWVACSRLLCVQSLALTSDRAHYAYAYIAVHDSPDVLLAAVVLWQARVTSPSYMCLHPC